MQIIGDYFAPHDTLVTITRNGLPVVDKQLFLQGDVLKIVTDDPLHPKDEPVPIVASGPGIGASKHTVELAVIPGIYQHYKGNKYRVLFVCLCSDNPPQDYPPITERTRYVVYTALYGDGEICCRKESEFLELVDVPFDHGKYVRRFDFVKA